MKGFIMFLQEFNTRLTWPLALPYDQDNPDNRSDSTNNPLLALISAFFLALLSAGLCLDLSCLRKRMF